MQYTIEEVSPVSRKIAVTVPVEEVEASIASTIAMYRTSISLDGFRKGKVPSSMVEKRFNKEIYQEATTELVNVHINEIIGETKLAPVSRIDFDGGQLERGKEFTYTISFDVMPEFDLPNYDGFAVEQEATIVDDSEVSSVVERLRANLAEVVTVGETRNPKAGDIAVIDFAAHDEKGEAIPGIQAENFQISIGEAQTLPDFEQIVCSLKQGENGEGPVTFPADFFNPEFAGKTVTMKVTVHAIKERKLPELDEAFAQKAGGFASMEKLQESVRDSYMKSREELNKSVAQKDLLDGLLKMVEFAVPESMVNSNIDIMIDDMESKLERQGKNLASVGKDKEALRVEVRPEAEARAKAQIFLMTVARKSELTVSEQEVDLQLRRMAMQSGQDFNTVKDYYSQNNLLFALRDRLLADKAMEAIYAKATVTIVPPKAADKPAENA